MQESVVVTSAATLRPVGGQDVEEMNANCSILSSQLLDPPLTARDCEVKVRAIYFAVGG